MLSLVEQEQIIEDNLEGFVKGFRALVEIRVNWDTYQRETPYDKFTDYCRGRWANLNLPPSTFYHKLDVIEINALLPEPIPTDSHATALHKYLGNDSELINAAWQEVNETAEKPTAKYVETVAKKHALINENSPLGQLVKYQQISPDKAYALKKVLDRLPNYYVEAVYSFGIGEDSVSGDTLNAIRALENYDKDAALDILRGGYLEDTPLWQLTARDVQVYLKRLLYENTQQRKLQAGTKQKASVGNKVKILDGLDIWDIDPTQTIMYYLFPNGDISPKELSKILEKNNMQVYFLVAYNKDNPPAINFDGQAGSPEESIVKPSNLINFIKNSVL